MLIATMAAGCGSQMQMPGKHSAITNTIPKTRNIPHKFSILNAVGNGDVKTTEEYLSSGENQKTTSDKANSLLARAIAGGHVAMIRLLLEKGADVNQRNSFGRTPLHRAVDLGSTAVVQLLVAHGADVDAKDGRGSTPLVSSAEMASRAVLNILLENGAEVGAENFHGRTALHNAARRDDKAVAELLIQRGAELNKVCEYGTPLDLAANAEVARLLQQYGGNSSKANSIAARTHKHHSQYSPSGTQTVNQPGF